MSEFNDLKKDLTETVNVYKEDLESSIQYLINKLGQNTKNALIISGTLFTAFLIARALNRRGSKEDIPEIEEIDRVPTKVIHSEPSFIKKMSDRVLEQTLLFLLSLAKEKLLDYLNEKFIDDEDIESNSRE